MTPDLMDDYELPPPCQPIGCDNGHHLPGCVFAVCGAIDHRRATEPPAVCTRPAGHDGRHEDDERIGSRTLAVWPNTD